jgi:hypothetical protein
MPVGQRHCRAPAGPATLAVHGWDCIDQREQLGDVVGVAAGFDRETAPQGHARISRTHCPRDVGVVAQSRRYPSATYLTWL